MWRIWRAPNNASKGQMGFNSAFKGLSHMGGAEVQLHSFVTAVPNTGKWLSASPTTLRTGKKIPITNK